MRPGQSKRDAKYTEKKGGFEERFGHKPATRLTGSYRPGAVCIYHETETNCNKSRFYHAIDTVYPFVSAAVYRL